MASSSMKVATVHGSLKEGRTGDMRFAKWRLDLAFHDFSFFFLAYFRDSGKRNFYIRDPWPQFLPFMSSAIHPPPRPPPPVRPSCYSSEHMVLSFNTVMDDRI